MGARKSFPHTSTSGLKSDVTIVFLDPDFLYSIQVKVGKCTSCRSTVYAVTGAMSLVISEQMYRADR